LGRDDETKTGKREGSDTSPEELEGKNTQASGSLERNRIEQDGT